MNINKKIVMILMVLVVSVCFASAAKKEPIILKQGDPLIIQQENKTAIYEIDYSKAIVVYGKKCDLEVSFYEWLIMQDEDGGTWVQSWEMNDSPDINKTFRECFNDNIKKSMKLTKVGKDYKVILRFSRFWFGNPSSSGSMRAYGGFAVPVATDAIMASGELIVLDMKTKETILILSFDKLEGDARYTHMGRFRTVISNLCDRIDDFLKAYKKRIEKENRKKKQ